MVDSGQINLEIEQTELQEQQPGRNENDNDAADVILQDIVNEAKEDQWVEKGN